MILDVRLRTTGPDWSVLDTVAYRFVGTRLPDDAEMYRAACEVRQRTPGCAHVFVLHEHQPWAYASTLAGPPG